MAQYGDVTFTIGGRQYTVRFGNLAWDSIYRALGVGDPGLAIARLLSGDKEARDVVLREGLATYHPEITTDDARRLYDQIPQEGERSLWSATWEALSLALPKMAAALEAAIKRGNEQPLPLPTAPITTPKTRARTTKRFAKRR